MGDELAMMNVCRRLLEFVETNFRGNRRLLQHAASFGFTLPDCRLLRRNADQKESDGLTVKGNLNS